MCDSVGCSETATKVCGSCKVERYCSAACQRAHWRAEHKQVCRNTWDVFAHEGWDANIYPEISAVRRPGPHDPDVFNGMLQERSMFVQGRAYHRDDIDTMRCYCGAGCMEFSVPVYEGLVVRTVQVDPARRQQGIFRSWLQEQKGLYGSIVFESVSCRGLRHKLSGDYGFRMAQGRDDVFGNPSYYWLSNPEQTRVLSGLSHLCFQLRRHNAADLVQLLPLEAAIDREQLLDIVRSAGRSVFSWTTDHTRPEACMVDAGWKFVFRPSEPGVIRFSRL